MNVRLIACLVLLALCGSAATTRAEALLDQGLAKMANAIRDFIDEEKLPRRIIVGEFPGVPSLKASGGVEISRSIEEQLERAGIEVSDEASLQVMGRFKLSKRKQFPEDDFDSLALEIEAQVLDDLGDELAELPISVFGSVALQIAGVNADLPAQASEKQRQQTIIDQLRQPKTEVLKSLGSDTHSDVRPTATSHFGMEVLVHNANKLVARPASILEKGRAFVDLHKGEEYVIRLRNDADFEAAVELTVDGVNIFKLAKDKKMRDSKLIVAAHSTCLVPGWFRDLQNTNAFEIGGYEDSVAKKQGVSTVKVGVITAKFRASFGQGIPRPADEPGRGANAKDATPPSKATILGRQVKKNYNQVQREFGVVRAVVNIRYVK